MTKRIVFLSPKCALDTRNGASTQMRTTLQILSERGYQCHTITASLFDGTFEFPLSSVVGPKAGHKSTKGYNVRVDHDGVVHDIFHTYSTQDHNFTKAEIDKWVPFVKKRLIELKPDVVISYCSDQVTRHLQGFVRQIADKMIFFLANPSYTDVSAFEHFDLVWCPSDYLARYYNSLLGLNPVSQWSVLPRSVAVEPAEVLPVAHPQHRRQGFVTMINPSPQKGGTLFLQMARMALRERPDLTFLALEGRMTDEQWYEAGVDWSGIPNVLWMSNQKDMRRIYQRTSVLLFPSYWLEASGRALAEAQLGGIPVLASNRAGIPEQLNGGGVLFDIPEVCKENFNKVPPEDYVRPWFDTLCRLMDEDSFYQETSQRAVEAARPFHPDVSHDAFVARFESWLARIDANRRESAAAQ